MFGDKIHCDGSPTTIEEGRGWKGGGVLEMNRLMRYRGDELQYVNA
jgi:hypothetical protein